MAELLLEEATDAALTSLEADSGRHELLARVNEVLDILEDDPGDRRVRRRRYQIIDTWGVPVHGDGEDWLVLWDLQGSQVVIRYLGPDL